MRASAEDEEVVRVEGRRKWGCCPMSVRDNGVSGLIRHSTDGKSNEKDGMRDAPRRGLDLTRGGVVEEENGRAWGDRM